MKKTLALSAALAALLATSGMASAADVFPYVKSTTGQTVMSNYDLCWRTGFWTPALAASGRLLLPKASNATLTSPTAARSFWLLTRSLT